jgi:hypothetical protein
MILKILKSLCFSRQSLSSSSVGIPMLPSAARLEECKKAVLSGLTGCYKAQQPFQGDAALKALRRKTSAIIDADEFVQCLEILVVEGRLTCFADPGQPKLYSLAGPVVKRHRAKDTLVSIFQTIREIATEAPVKVKDIEAWKNHQSQMVRTAIDVLLGLGLVMQTGKGGTIEIQWNSVQANALFGTASNIAEARRLEHEIQHMDKEIAGLREKMQMHEFQMQ